MNDLVAVVTGGSRGIGLAVAQRLVRDGVGVVLTGRSSDSLRRAQDALASDRVLVVGGRTDDPEHRAEVLDTARRQLGGVDLLVNNAAVNPRFGSLRTFDEQTGEKILRANVLACLGWARDFAEGRPDNRPGAIVNISSFATLRPSPGLGMYAASKAALRQLTKDLALELAPVVRVNTVTPALIKTDFASVLYENREQAVARTYPMQRLGTPDDVAAAVTFLLSPQASWITGAELLIDGGLALTGGIR